MLAVGIVPLVLADALRARSGGASRPIGGIARVTLPLWAYVSVTAWSIYWMLYRPVDHGAGHRPPADDAAVLRERTGRHLATRAFNDSADAPASCLQLR